MKEKGIFSSHTFFANKIISNWKFSLSVAGAARYHKCVGDYSNILQFDVIWKFSKLQTFRFRGFGNGMGLFDMRCESSVKTKR